MALRSYSEFEAGRRERAECIPERLEAGNTYEFLKEGQRVYWLEGETPLLETKGSQQLSSPIASIIILEATHFLREEKPYTKGKYKVIEVFEDKKIHFDGFKKV